MVKHHETPRVKSPLKTEWIPRFEFDHFLAGVRQPGDFPGFDRVHKLFFYAVAGLMNILAHKAHDGEEMMFPVILPHELQDVELVFRQISDSFLYGEDARYRFRPVFKIDKEPVIVNGYPDIFVYYHRHWAFSSK
jgi:hypothetical protein